MKYEIIFERSIVKVRNLAPIILDIVFWFNNQSISRQSKQRWVLPSVMNQILKFHIRLWFLLELKPNTLFWQGFINSTFHPPSPQRSFEIIINLCLLHHIPTYVHKKARYLSSSFLHWELKSRHKNPYLQNSQSNQKPQSAKIKATKNPNRKH